MLRLAADYDGTIRYYMERFGPPDYMYVVDGSSVQFIFVKDERLMVFQRPAFSTDSTPMVIYGLPESLTSIATSAWFPRCWAAEAARGATRTTCSTCCRADTFQCETTCK
jgi:hypothetical protein